MNAGDPIPPLIERLRNKARLWAPALLSLAAGLALALVLHYALYRIGIPGTPFIYVVF